MSSKVTKVTIVSIDPNLSNTPPVFLVDCAIMLRLAIIICGLHFGPCILQVHHDQGNALHHTFVCTRVFIFVILTFGVKVILSTHVSFEVCMINTFTLRGFYLPFEHVDSRVAPHNSPMLSCIPNIAGCLNFALPTFVQDNRMLQGLFFLASRVIAWPSSTQYNTQHSALFGDNCIFAVMADSSWRALLCLLKTCGAPKILKYLSRGQHAIHPYTFLRHKIHEFSSEFSDPHSGLASSSWWGPCSIHLLLHNLWKKTIPLHEWSISLWMPCLVYRITKALVYLWW